MSTKIEKIDTGLVAFPLEFDRGTEVIYFNPFDAKLFSRISEMITHLPDLHSEFDEKYNATNDIVEQGELIREFSDKIESLFDVAFGNKVSDGIFKYVSPLGFVKGKQEYYTLYILGIIAKKIEKELGETSELVRQALSKTNNQHVAKYAHKINK